MSLIVKVYPVPWKILALVKARILKNRAQRRKEGEGWDPKELRRQMQLQPGPLTKAMKKQEPSFILPDDTFSYLLRPTKEHEPEKPWDAYEFTAYGLPDQFFVVDGRINNALIDDLNFIPVDSVIAFYSTHARNFAGEPGILENPIVYPSHILETCTIEAIFDTTYIDQNIREYYGFSVGLNVKFEEMTKDANTKFSATGNFIFFGQGITWYAEENGQILEKAIVQDCVSSNGYEPRNVFVTTRQKSKTHAALVFSENIISFYVDGQKLSSQPASKPNILKPGKMYGITITTYFHTKGIPFVLQALRVTGGTALYTGKTFTPPTAITEPAA